MNTPKPCCHCGNLYVNCLFKNDPYYEAECMLELKPKDGKCNKLVDWREKRWFDDIKKQSR